MALVEWSDALAIGIPEIDYQHRNLVNMLNALDTALVEGEEREVIAQILDSVGQYVLTHFAAEEALMARIEYEFIDEHKAEHHRIAERADRLRQRFDEGEDTAGEMREFLIRWLLNHIAGVDSQIAGAMS